MSSLSAIKASTQARNREERAQTERHTHTLVLILSHLRQHGYIDAAAALLNESSEQLAKYDIADNIDLEQVIREYEDYYKLKFGRRPIFSKASNNTQHSGGGNTGRLPRSTTKRGRSSYDHTTTLPPLSTHQSTPTTKPLQSRKRALQDSDSTADQGVAGFALNSVIQKTNSTHSEIAEPRQPLKPLPNFGGDQELRSLALSIRRDIVEDCPNVYWNDIVGLDDAKRMLKEAMVLPRKYPQLFTGIRSPWKSCLLYGLPGTGKTLLAKAVANECSTTFFNISASSIVSKFRGDSEKLIRMVFDLARHYSPSTIFIDEADSIMSHRGGGALGTSANECHEHESSRRMKTELLVQMDGLVSNNSEVFILVATNLPWEIDSAFHRRLEKSIMIPLPSHESRKQMLTSHLSELSPMFSHGSAFLEQAASAIDGYSGSDIKTLCKEVAMRQLRRILQHVEVMDGSSDTENLSLLMRRNPVTAQDYNDSIAVANRSTSADLVERQKKWSKSHGSS